jgi:hypothetical protein
MKARRQQIGPRVTEHTYEALKRLAAATGCSVSNYCEQVLANHVEKERGADEGALRQLEQHFMEGLAQLQSATDHGIKRLERNLNAIRAMVDAQVEVRDPQLVAKYRQIVTDTLRAMGITIVTANGARQ